MRFSGKTSAEWGATDFVEPRQITPREADEILEEWESKSLRVCFAVSVGDLAWKAHWVGTIRSARFGRWVLVSQNTTNMVSTGQYKQITLIEDGELMGLRFQQVEGATSGFEVDLFISKIDGLEDSLPLINKMIQ